MPVLDFPSEPSWNILATHCQGQHRIDDNVTAVAPPDRCTKIQLSWINYQNTNKSLALLFGTFKQANFIVHPVFSPLGWWPSRFMASLCVCC